MSIKGQSYTSGYRYYFSVLAGICRGPIDEIFLIKSDGKTFWDGSHRNALKPGDRDILDPAKPAGFEELAVVARAGGSIVDNETLIISSPDVYGGEKSEGGIVGLLSVYMGAKLQIIAAADYIKTVMSDLLLSDFRGVVTVFFDGEVCANNPYPKAWQYRIRRALKGWDGPVWYPQRAIIKLTDPGIPQYTRGSGDTGITTVTTVIYNSDGAVSGGAGGSSGSSYVRTVTSTYSGATVNTYNSVGGTQTNYAVPLEYNDISAMNPAHIIYECATNRDWGRGLDRLLIDNVSFTDAANTLYTEGFGLCFKWSRAEDVDTFVQTVLDHIGGVVYTDKLTGLLCLRLVRNDYVVANLSVFDYTSGLLEVTSADVPAQDMTANEVIVKYRSPVIDMDREARAQNIASMDSLGCVYSTTRDYSGIPISTLALQVAQRDLQIFSGGWKKVEAKLDRRAYALNPGDVIIINAPDRHCDNLIVRVATVEESKVNDGSITITGAQDIFGLPVTPMIVPQPSEFMESNRTPSPIVVDYLMEATYRDVLIFKGSPGDAALQDDAAVGYLSYHAQKPTPSSLNFAAETSNNNLLHPDWASFLTVWENVGTIGFTHLSKLKTSIGTTDTVIPVTGDITPGRIEVGQALLIQTNYLGYPDITYQWDYTPWEEIVRLDAITKDSTGQVYIVVGRGCNDTPTIPHKAGARVWVHDEAGVNDPNEHVFYDDVVIRGFVHTTAGDAKTARTSYPGPVIISERIYKPYSGADFRVNGYPRDATPLITGDLVLTWKHRNRLSIEDQLVAENEPTALSPEADVAYDVYITATTASGRFSPVSGSPWTHYSAPYFTGNTLTITEAELRAHGVVDGKMKVSLVTKRTSGGGGQRHYADAHAWRAPAATFYYGTVPDTTAVGFGFNYDMNIEFDGVAP